MDEQDIQDAVAKSSKPCWPENNLGRHCPESLNSAATIETHSSEQKCFIVDMEEKKVPGSFSTFLPLTLFLPSYKAPARRGFRAGVVC